MRRFHSFLLATAALLLPLSAAADQRGEEQARQIAEQYMAQRGHISKGKLMLAPQKQVAKAAARGKQNVKRVLDTPYYIYNDSQEGFVVVSGSDNMRPVLAYSDKGSLDVDNPNMPDGLRYWLGYAAEAAQYVEAHPEAAITPAMLAPYADVNIKGLLGDIKWGQGAPFNNQCPTNCWTGCMATAMAQVMRYHEWPKEASNGHSYDFSKMLPKYNGGQGDATQKAEVAKLLHDVGLSLHMEYGTSSSGSVSTMYAAALRDVFHYNSRLALVNRDCYTFGEWLKLTVGELQAGRPLIYDGVSSEGGHAFVIHGYNGLTGLFVVNWGWEGMSDGEYDICVLNPPTTGVGAQLNDQFTQYQDCIVNLCPEEGTGSYVESIFTYNTYGGISTTTTTARVGGTANLIADMLYNFYSTSYSGEWGALIKQGDEVIAKCRVGTLSGSGATMQSNIQLDVSGSTWTIPADLPDGDYRVYGYTQRNGSSEYNLLHVVCIKPNWVDMKVRDGVCTFSQSEYYPNGLSVSNWSFDVKTPEVGSSGLSCLVTNTSDEVIYGRFNLSFDAPKTLTKVYYNQTDYTINPGESVTVSFPVTYTKYGTYTINALNYNRTNITGSAHEKIATNVKFTIKDPSEGGGGDDPDVTVGPQFTLNEMWFEQPASGPFTLGTNVKFGAELNNKGEDFDGDFRVLLYADEDMTQYTGVKGETSYTLAGKSTGSLGEVYVNVYLDQTKLSAGKTYYAVLDYIYKNMSFTDFTLPIGITNKLRMNIASADGIGAVTTADASQPTFSIDGRRVRQAKAHGVYVVGGKKVIK